MVLVPAIAVPALLSGEDARVAAVASLGIPGAVMLVLEKADIAPSECAALLRAAPCRVGPLSDGAEAAEWLNAGAALVVLSAAGGGAAATAELAAELPRERVLASLSLSELEASGSTGAGALAALFGAVCGVVLEVPSTCGGGDADVAALRGAAAALEAAAEAVGTRKRLGLTVALVGHSGLAGSAVEALVGELHSRRKDYPVHVQAACRSTELGAAEGTLSLGRALLACLVTDRPDGLYATVVVDEAGVALGLVYSSAESVCASLEARRGVYYSRSRGGLWRKGDTSGATQTLLSVRFDCDADALRFCVRQNGDPPSFCHQGHRSCWGPDAGLPALFRVLEGRRRSAPEGSYTKRLFDDRALLKNKMLEEAQELAEAVEEGDQDHVAAETADVIYFALVACCAGGSTLEAAAAHLDRRALKVKRRPGNAKAYRIAAATAALAK